jgi:mono/diheme cytochrome c family protein
MVTLPGFVKFTLLGFILAIGLSGADALAAKKKVPAPKEMNRAYLKEPAHIETGRKVWEKQCRHCHGAKAYPGKAPKLKPSRYKNRPAFVWDRVTNGFRKMPAWKDKFTAEERMGVVAYILSRSFSP